MGNLAVGRGGEVSVSNLKSGLKGEVSFCNLESLEKEARSVGGKFNSGLQEWLPADLLIWYRSLINRKKAIIKHDIKPVHICNIIEHCI